MISRLFAAAARATLATCVVATTLSAAGPAFAAEKPDLRLMITASDTKVALGDSVDFTFTVGNIGKVAVGSALLKATITGAQSLSIIHQPSGQPNDCTLSGTDLTCTKLVLGAFSDDSDSDFANVVVRATASSSSTTRIEAEGTADPKNDLDEADESNNTTNLNVTVFRLPDLRAKITDAPEYVHGSPSVTFTVQVDNLGGGTDHIDLDFRTTSGLTYDSVDFVDNVKHGFKCDMHNPFAGTNYVSCTGGSLGDDESVTVKIGAEVALRGLTADHRTVTLQVDPDHNITESHESNNKAEFTYYYR